MLAGAPAGTSAADGPEAIDETEGHGGAKKSKGRGKVIAIILWTTAVTLAATGILTVLTG